MYIAAVAGIYFARSGWTLQTTRNILRGASVLLSLLEKQTHRTAAGEILSSAQTELERNFAQRTKQIHTQMLMLVQESNH